VSWSCGCNLLVLHSLHHLPARGMYTRCVCVCVCLSVPVSASVLIRYIFLPHTQSIDALTIADIKSKLIMIKCSDCFVRVVTSLLNFNLDKLIHIKKFASKMEIFGQLQPTN